MAVIYTLPPACALFYLIFRRASRRMSPRFHNPRITCLLLILFAVLLSVLHVLSANSIFYGIATLALFLAFTFSLFRADVRLYARSALQSGLLFILCNCLAHALLMLYRSDTAVSHTFQHLLHSFFLLLCLYAFSILSRYFSRLRQRTLQHSTWFFLFLALLFIVLTAIYYFSASAAAQYAASMNAPWFTPLVRNDFTVLFFMFIQLTLLCFLFVLTSQTSMQAYDRAQAELRTHTAHKQLETYRQELSDAHIIRTIQHDMYAHLSRLKQLGLSQNKTEQRAFIQQLLTDLKRPDSDIQSGNLLVDSILSDAIARMESIGVTVKLELSPLPTRMQLEDIELCSLLSNALTNALEGCERIPTDAVREIAVYLAIRDNALVLRLSNSCPDASAVARSAFHLSSKSSGRRGIGLVTLNSIVTAHGGEISLEPSESNDQLVLRLFIPDVLPVKEG